MRERMEALTQSIVTSAHERQMAVADARQQTGKMLREFGRARAAMAKALKSSLVADRNSRSVDVCALLADACTQRADFAKAHRHMARALRADLSKARRSRSWDVAELIGGFHKSRSDMAQELSDSLTTAMRDIRFHVSGLREWQAVSLQRGREDASAHRQVPNYLLPDQGTRTARGASPVHSRELEAHADEPGKKTIPVVKAVHAAGRMAAKPKKR